MIPHDWRDRLIHALYMRGCRGDLAARKHWAMGETVLVPVGSIAIYVRLKDGVLVVWCDDRETTAHTVEHAARRVKRAIAGYHKMLKRTGRRPK